MFTLIIVCSYIHDSQKGIIGKTPCYGTFHDEEEQRRTSYNNKILVGIFRNMSACETSYPNKHSY